MIPYKQGEGVLYEELWLRVYTDGFFTYYVQPLSAKRVLTTEPSLPGTAPVNGYKILSKRKFYVNRIDSWQQSTPASVPPGLGFREMQKRGLYTPITTHIVDTKLSSKGSGIIYHRPQSSPISHVHIPRVFTWEYWPVDKVYKHTTELHRTAVRNLYASLGRRVKVNGGVMMVELKETMGLVGKALTSLLQVLRAVKKGRVSDALAVISAYGGTKTRKQLLNRSALNRRRKAGGLPEVSKTGYTSNAWLETQFGWLPMIQDIYSLIEYITELLSDPEKTGWMSFKGVSNRSLIMRDVVGKHDLTAMNFRDTLIINEKKGYIATFKIADSVTDFLNSIGLINPASVAWEVVPFSFVLDWILPVGDYLESFSATAGLEQIETAVFSKQDYSYSSVVDSFDGPASNVSFSETYNEVRHLFERVTTDFVGEGLPEMPLPEFSFMELFDAWIAVTSAALIRQVFGRK